MASEPNVQGDRSRSWILSLALAALTVLTYGRSLGLPFVHYDDDAYVFENAQVRAGLTGDGVRWAFTTYHSANWHPLTWLSLQLDATLFGSGSASGFHCTNVLLHALNAVLLFLVLLRMTGAVWRSTVVAALFAVHPVHVESVSWVAERKDVLSTLFWMLTLAAYVHYVQRPSAGRYLLVALALGLGLLAKPMLVTLPFVLLLLDCWPLGRWSGLREPATSPVTRRSLGALVLEKVPLIALALASCFVTFVAQRQGNAVQTIEQVPVAERLANALLAYAGYLGKMLWPFHLCVHYPRTHTPLAAAAPLVAAFLVIAITVLVLGPGRRRLYLAVGWLWYLGTLVPVLGLVQVGDQGMADRYSYVPSVGLFILAAWGVRDLVQAWRLPVPVVATGTGLILFGCMLLTWAQQGYWSDDISLWTHAVDITGKNGNAHHHLGLEYARAGRREEALAEFSRAVLDDPTFVMGHFHVGVLLCELGRWQDAPAEYQRVLELAPTFPGAHCDLGNVFWHLGRYDDALEECQKALALDPNLIPAYQNLGSVLRELGRSEAARLAFQQGIERQPNSASLHCNLGVVLRDLARSEEALGELRAAIDLDATNVEAHAALGDALLDEGRYDEAEEMTRRALALRPPDPAVQELLVRQLDRCRSLRELERKLPAVVNDTAQPASTSERLELAWLCMRPRQQLYAAAVRLYTTAFAADPGLAYDLGQQHRYAAACAAVRAGTAQGKDLGALDESLRARLRTQALEWLQADLALWNRQVSSPGAPGRFAAQRALRDWQRNPHLSAVRTEPDLAKLAPAEREAWRNLWNEVTALLARASAAPPFPDAAQQRLRENASPTRR